MNDAGNSAIRIEMDMLKPDFAGMTWNEWKDTHAEVSMAMHLLTSCIYANNQNAFGS